MNTESRERMSGASWPAVLAGMALFVWWGLVLIGGEIPHAWEVPIWVTPAVQVLFVGTIVLPPLGLCLGWMRGFPRWSYPYVGHVLVFSQYMTHVSTPGFLFGRELWGWRAWVPFAVAVGVALLVTRSLRPLGTFFTQIWHDWTLATFGMCGFLSLLVGIGFDEVDRLYSLYFMVLLAAVMVAMAWMYMRASQQRQRVWALLAGIVTTLGVTAVAPTLYWQREGWVLPQLVALYTVAIVLFMFSPALIGLWQRGMRAGAADPARR
ncbi:MAG: hypothetical protein FJ026_10955 [Chloroflexi bacterium]|nr:hypothetical protein [Chloroflexota bacterium]